MNKEIKNVDEVAIMTRKPKKKKIFIKGLFIFLAIIVLIVIALGFTFPGLIWTKSLGINYTQADYNSIMDKLGIIKDAVPTGDSQDQYDYIYGDVANVEVEFTSEEITAFFNENRPDYYPIKNVQVKINEDGSIEAAGSVNVDYFLNDVLGGKYTRQQIESEMPALGLLPDNVNIYLNFTGSVTNNISSISISEVTVQGISVPSSYLTSSVNINAVTTGLDKLMTDYCIKSGANFEKIAVENGVIKFKGSVPTSLERIEK